MQWTRSGQSSTGSSGAADVGRSPGCHWHTIDRRIGVVVFRGAVDLRTGFHEPEWIRLQQLLHLVPRLDRVGDLRADVLRRRERRGHRLDAEAPQLQTKEIESDALERRDRLAQSAGSEVACVA